MQHDHTQAPPEIMPLEQLAVAPLGELRRQAELIAATADAALTRYTALRRCRKGTAPEPIEAAHATWRARYQLRDQVTAIIRKREQELGQGENRRRPRSVAEYGIRRVGPETQASSREREQLS